MPPKRKILARSASTGKSVRIGDTSVIPIPTASPFGRPRRSTAAEIQYELPSLRTAMFTPIGSRAKYLQEGTAPNAAATTVDATPKRRGRPAKATATEAVSTKPVATPVKAARGRPKKSDATEPAPALTPKSSKRKRDDVEEPASAPVKKRGRPPKAATPETKAAPSRKQRAVKVQKDELVATKPAAKKGPKPKAAPAATAKPVARRGRPAKTVTSTKTATKAAKAKTLKGMSETEPESEVGDFVEGLTQSDEVYDDVDAQYWLMKAEPDERIVNNRDVSYPIDKLAAATEPEPWDGVRSAVARNKMRAMRKGDLAFFYHSNCDVPGIVGVMRIVEEHSVDQSAFDLNHPYYDETSDPAKPKWDCVKVEFVKKFNDKVTLKQLKADPNLSDMKIAQKAYGRLSVQEVAPAHWQYVLKMAGEPEDLGVPTKVSGYEADTNGETDKEAVEDSVGIDDVDARKLAAYGSPDDSIDDDDEDELVDFAAVSGGVLPTANGATVHNTVTTDNRMTAIENANGEDQA